MFTFTKWISSWPRARAELTVFGLLLALLFVPVWLLQGATPPLGWTTECRIIKVVDGDTVDVEVRRVLRIRLLNCWAPESRTRDLEEKKRGLASKQHLQQLVAADADGLQILHIPGSTSLGDVLTLDRVIGEVWLTEGEEPSLNACQVTAGHAAATKQ